MSMSTEQHLQWITLISRICYIGLLIWPLYLFVSLFTFDQPGAQKMIITWLLVIPIWILPLLVVIAPRLATAVLAKGEVVWSYFIMAVPVTLLLLPIVLAFVGVLLEMVNPVT